MTARIMRSALIVLIVATPYAASQSARSRTELENVAAFARLYGVVRYFYPSDAAAAMDWDRFAVYGIKQVRSARNASTLARELKELFTPLGPGLLIANQLPLARTGPPDPSLVAWRTRGVAAVWPMAYRASRTNRPYVDGYVIALTQKISASQFRGKTIRLQGRVRVRSHSWDGVATLRLVVGRGNQGTGFADRMDNRPIRDSTWRDYIVEGPVAQDATEVTVGVSASGAVIADFDALTLYTRAPSEDWMPVPLEDAGFEAPGAEGPWRREGNAKSVVISRPTDQAQEGQRFLRIAPPALGTPEAAALDAAGREWFGEFWTPTAGAYADVGLGLGIRAHVALALTDAEARSTNERPSGTLAALRREVQSVTGPSETPDVDARLADVVVAWNLFRHFYPYWSDVDVDWDSRLIPQLEAAYRAVTRDGAGDALRALVVEARDGHGHVFDSLRGEVNWPDGRAQVPLRFGLVDGHVIVTMSAVPDRVSVGARVSTIDGIPAEDRFQAGLRLVSGSERWRVVKTLIEIAKCTKGRTMKVLLDTGHGPREIDLECHAAEPGAPPPPAEARPEPISEVFPGVWYVDLTRARTADVKPMLQTLAAAGAVVFDMRGYPTDAGYDILPYLIDSPEADRWMHVAKIIGPFGQLAGWEHSGWDLKPAAPRIAGKRVFMTNAGAISYAESVMGYVADRKLGTIIGGQTAGTNGNVCLVRLPGGFVVRFTGLRVTGHDGQTPFHLVGVKPDIPMSPTLAGVRAGRDEVLERAIAFVRQGTK